MNEPTSEQGVHRTLRILLVGEGNLSYAHALVKRLSSSAFVLRWRGVPTIGIRGLRTPAATSNGIQCELLATTFDSRAELVARYPEAVPILSYFASKSRLHLSYAGNVNATDLKRTLSENGHAMYDPDVVIFNNPHVGYEDLFRQTALISHFFASVRTLFDHVDATGTVTLPRLAVVALCDDQPARWGLLAAAARSGFICVAAVPLLAEDFPEYENKRHQSDAKFPYQVMVQYYFIHASAPDAFSLVLEKLLPIVKTWPQGAKGTTATQKAPTVHTEDWLRSVDMVDFGISSTVAEGGVVSAAKTVRLPALHQAVQAAMADGHDDSEKRGCVAQYSFRSSLPFTPCFPLIHPRLFFAASEELHGQIPTDPSEDGKPKSLTSLHMGARKRFSPFIDVRVLPELYTLQASIETCPFDGEHNDATAVEIPPTLDTAVLGRPLTHRESVKLSRFLEKKKRNSSKSAPGPVAVPCVAAAVCAEPEESTAVLLCPHCSESENPSGTGSGEARGFKTETGLRDHILSKHTGAVKLRANMHARVHQQIVTRGSDNDTPLTSLVETMLVIEGGGSSDQTPRYSGTKQRYCSICDLLFTTDEAYEEHLAFLSPRAARFLCTECTEHNDFPDERALQQHRALKHHGKLRSAHTCDVAEESG